MAWSQREWRWLRTASRAQGPVSWKVGEPRSLKSERWKAGWRCGEEGAGTCCWFYYIGIYVIIYVVAAAWNRINNGDLNTSILLSLLCCRVLGCILKWIPQYRIPYCYACWLCYIDWSLFTCNGMPHHVFCRGIIRLPAAINQLECYLLLPRRRTNLWVQSTNHPQRSKKDAVP
jgi:hypothetical protein